jgi:CBS domain-containing protein
MPGPGGRELSLFVHRVRDLLARPAVTCAASASVADVARVMAAEQVGSTVVLAETGAPVGIVTDRDLRSKVVAAGRDSRATTAASIMSSPVVTTSPTTFAFEALLEMTRRGIHHLPVVDDGRCVGVLSSHDVLRWQTPHPVLLAREIAAAATVAGLAELAARTTPLIARFAAERGGALDVARIVAELNDRLVRRALELTAATLRAAGLGEAPAAWCWLAFGSEARREQTLRTDQDNGLVYADPPPRQRAAAAEYFTRFAQEAIAALVTIGFPPCPGGVMASNPRWCQPVSAWAGSFRTWIDHPSPAEILDACIFFDLRPLAGDLAQAEALREIIRDEAPKSRVFLGLLARDVVERRVPLTVLGNIAVARSGRERGTVDVKAAGGMQLVGAARVAALELGIIEPSTMERLLAAGERGLYTAAEAREIVDAYGHLLRLRLVRQLACVAAGQPLDNRVDPTRLSRADALLFRDALKTTRRVQAGLRERFATQRLG